MTVSTSIAVVGQLNFSGGMEGWIPRGIGDRHCQLGQLFASWSHPRRALLLEGLAPEGPRGQVVKLGLDHFLRTTSEQADFAYADVVRMTGHDPATEILTRMRSSGRQ